MDHLHTWSDLSLMTGRIFYPLGENLKGQRVKKVGLQSTTIFASKSTSTINVINLQSTTEI